MAIGGFDARTYQGRVFIVDSSTSLVKEAYNSKYVTVEDWGPSANELLVSSDGNVGLLDLLAPTRISALTSGIGAGTANGGDRIAVITSLPDGVGLKVLDLMTEQEMTFPERVLWRNAFDVVWSPDDTQLLVSATALGDRQRIGIFLVNVGSMSVSPLTPVPPGHEIHSPRWVSNTLITFLDRSIHDRAADLVVYDLPSGCASRFEIMSATEIAFAPDRSRAAYTTGNELVYMLDQNEAAKLLAPPSCPE